MNKQQEFEVQFDKDIAREITERHINIEDELSRVHPELELRYGASAAPGTGQRRDVALIITALGGLVSALSPLIIEILRRRLGPTVEIETVEELGENGRRIIKVIRRETNR